MADVQKSFKNLACLTSIDLNYIWSDLQQCHSAESNSDSQDDNDEENDETVCLFFSINTAQLSKALVLHQDANGLTNFACELACFRCLLEKKYTRMTPMPNTHTSTPSQMYPSHSHL